MKGQARLLKATEAYRRFMALVDAFVDEMSEKCAVEIEKEAKDARGKAGAAARARRSRRDGAD